jgi:hypothetical protein
MRYAEEWVRARVRGKTFADIGGLWGTVNEMVTVAMKAGATKADMIDISPSDSILWERFRQRCVEEGVTGYRCICTDINDPQVTQALSVYDVVYCSGVLYHCPDPLQTTMRLAERCQRFLILGSVVIPSRLSGSSGELVTEPGSALFVPALNASQKIIVSEYFKEVGAADMVGIDCPCHWSIDDYAPWWWLFTAEFVAGVLGIAGFRILNTAQDWEGRVAVCLAEKVAGKMRDEETR